MLLTCENCETIFRIESAQLKTPGQQVRCSVCKHVWAPDVINEDPVEPQLIRESISVLRFPIIICVAITLLLTLIGFNRGTITSYVPITINAFDMAGLTVRPDLTKLEVRNLKANYAGDTLRVSGNLANKSSLRVHAAPLQLTISDADEVVLHTQRIQPADLFINSGNVTDFFIQIDIEKTNQAEVSVTPLAIRIDPTLSASQ